MLSLEQREMQAAIERETTQIAIIAQEERRAAEEAAATGQNANGVTCLIVERMKQLEGRVQVTTTLPRLSDMIFDW